MTMDNNKSPIFASLLLQWQTSTSTPARGPTATRASALLLVGTLRKPIRRNHMLSLHKRQRMLVAAGATLAAALVLTGCTPGDTGTEVEPTGASAEENEEEGDT